MANPQRMCVGYVGFPSQQEVEKSSVFQRLPDIKIGKHGLERAFGPQLRGQPGVQQIEVNAHGYPVRELSMQDSIPGTDLTTTLDAELQQHIVQQIGEKESASVVVMDVHSGAVRALVSTPSFDPNRFSHKITTDYWNALREDPRVPLLNKAVAGQYPPGSTFKMVTALAALESGLVSSHEEVFCPGHLDFGSRRFHCWKQGGHGFVDVRKALMQSCDVYFYQVSHTIGVERIAEMARHLGLDVRTGIELPDEKAGRIPDPAWKRQYSGKHWNPGETLNTSIGQGDVLTTPLQLARMTAMLVNGGKLVRPTRVPPSPHAHSDADALPSIDIRDHNLRAVLDGMYAVVNTPRGTAYAQHDPEGDFVFAGKTGTAQVRKIVHHYNDRFDSWKERDHALFVGFAPYESPRYSVAVVVEHGGHGSSVAAPIAASALKQTLLLDKERSDV